MQTLVYQTTFDVQWQRDMAAAKMTDDGVVLHALQHALIIGVQMLETVNDGVTVNSGDVWWCRCPMDFMETCKCCPVC